MSLLLLFSIFNLYYIIYIFYSSRASAHCHNTFVMTHHNRVVIKCGFFELDDRSLHSLISGHSWHCVTDNFSKKFDHISNTGFFEMITHFIHSLAGILSWHLYLITLQRSLTASQIRVSLR